MNHQSYITLPADKVIDLTTRTLNEIHERRTECSRRFLERRISKMWLRKLFGKVPTLVELHNEIEAVRGTYFDSYHFIVSYWRDEEETAERLFAIGLNSEDGLVHVTAADFAHIGMPLPADG